MRDSVPLQFPRSAPRQKVHDSQGSCVLVKFPDARIVTGSTPLPLASEKGFKGILTKMLAQEGNLVVLHFGKSEEEAHQANK